MFFLKRILLNVVLLCITCTFSVVGAEDSPPEAKNLDAPLSAAAKIIRETNPTTPTELIKAIDQLVAFGDMGLAKSFAQQLGKKDDPDSRVDLVAIGDSLGPVPLLRIANNAEFDSTARNFCKKILGAMRKRDNDPERLRSLAKLVVGKTPQIRRDALPKMRAAGPAAVSPLVMILLNGSAIEQAGAKKGLVYMGSQAVPPLLAVLETENEELHNNILSILTNIAHPAAVDDIRIATLNSSDIQNKERISSGLHKSIRDYLSGRKVASRSPSNNCTLWEWNDEKPSLSHREVSKSLLDAGTAYRLAHALSLTNPGEKNTLLEAAALLQFEKLNKGLDQKIDLKVPIRSGKLTDEQKQNLKDLNFIEAVFELSLDQGYVPAATGAAELLEQQDVSGGKGIELIARRGADTHPLITALNHGDRRLRIAACAAIIKLSEAHPFIGTSNVSDALRYFAASRGKPRVFIADTQVIRRQRIASMLTEAGYITDVYKNGRSALSAAQQQPDYIAGFISFTIGPLSIGDILHELRTDSRTTGLPIGILVDPVNDTQALNLVGDDPMASVFFMPTNSQMAGQDVKQLTRLSGDGFVSDKERLQQARKAITRFKMFMQQSKDSYDPNAWLPILVKSLEIEELTVPTADILAQLKTPQAQRALVEATSNPYLPLATRKITSQALKKSLADHGIGLSVAEIQQQKERYDATEGKNPEEEAIQWSILQSINQAAKKGRD